MVQVGMINELVDEADMLNLLWLAEC
jgi:hypothetical protein